jgi:hypothetical protein
MFWRAKNLITNKKRLVIDFKVLYKTKYTKTYKVLYKFKEFINEQLRDLNTNVVKFTTINNVDVYIIKSDVYFVEIKGEYI